MASALMIIPPGQRSSRLLSFSVEASNISEGSKDVKESKEVRPKAKSKEPKESRAKAVGRPKSAARRESPLAAAARRARDAVAAHSANARAKATAAGTAVAAVPKAAAKAATSSGYAARSLIERPDGGRLEKPKSQQKPPSADNASPKGLVGKMGEVLETSETSAGSTPKCVLSEDTNKMPEKAAERAEILEAAQVLRREALDLGQALRQWVAEAEAEAEDAQKEAPTSSVAQSVAISEAVDEVHLVSNGTEARPNSPVLADPEVAVGRQHLEHECERLDADLQRVAGEWHRLWSERQRTIEALSDQRSRPLAPPAPLPLPARATLGAALAPPPPAPCPARATVPVTQVRGLARTPSPLARMPLVSEPGAVGYPPSSPVMSPFTRGVSPLVSFRYTTGSPVSPLVGSSPLQVQRRTISPVPTFSPARSVSPYRLVQARPVSPLPPQLPMQMSCPAVQAPVGSRFLVPRGTLQVGTAPRPRPARDGHISHL